MELVPNAEQQFFYANGSPLVNGMVGFYIPTTMTPKNTYTTQAGNVANANPIALDGNGCAIIWGSGNYRQIVQDSNGNTIWDQVTYCDAAGVLQTALASASSDTTSGATMIGFIPSGNNSVAGTVQKALEDAWIFADNYSGVTVANKIDAAIAAADSRIVVIPPSMGAGEGTTYAPGVNVVDLRSGTPLSGGKIVYGGSDSNGQVRFLVLNDITNQINGSAAACIFSTRVSGALATGGAESEGTQTIASTFGTLTGTLTGLSAAEFDTTTNSDGGTVTDLWGINIVTGSSGTTAIGNATGLYIPQAVYTGSSLGNYYGIHVASANCSNLVGSQYSAYFEDTLKLGDVIQQVSLFGVSNLNYLSSGASNLYWGIDIGRTSREVRLAVAANTNDFFTGTSAGDGIYGTAGGNSSWVQAAGIGVMKFQGTKVNSFLPFYPAALAGAGGAQQSNTAIWGGSGAPNSSYGNDGDIYFRSDGGSMTTIYQHRTGSWTGIV